MIKNIFCTSTVVFRRVFCTLIAILICLGSVAAITPEELHEQIKYAYNLVKHTELVLMLRAPRLTELWLREKTNDEGHEAEIELRRLYPQEYMDYVSAKVDLDDLLYTQFLMFANGKAE